MHIVIIDSHRYSLGDVEGPIDRRQRLAYFEDQSSIMF